MSAVERARVEYARAPRPGRPVGGKRLCRRRERHAVGQLVRAGRWYDA